MRSVTDGPSNVAVEQSTDVVNTLCFRIIPLVVPSCNLAYDRCDNYLIVDNNDKRFAHSWKLAFNTACLDATPAMKV